MIIGGRRYRLHLGAELLRWIGQQHNNKLAKEATAAPHLLTPARAPPRSNCTTSSPHLPHFVNTHILSLVWAVSGTLRYQTRQLLRHRSHLALYTNCKQLDDYIESTPRKVPEALDTFVRSPGAH